MTGRLLTARVVAQQLGLSTETVLAWVRRGDLPAFRLPSGQLRIDENQLERWLQERATSKQRAVENPAGRRPTASIRSVENPNGKEPNDPHRP